MSPIVEQTRSKESWATRSEKLCGKDLTHLSSGKKKEFLFFCLESKRPSLSTRSGKLCGKDLTHLSSEKKKKEFLFFYLENRRPLYIYWHWHMSMPKFLMLFLLVYSRAKYFPSCYVSQQMKYVTDLRILVFMPTW